MAPPLPSRVHDLATARARFGDFADRFVPALTRVDPLADAVAADFAALGSQSSRAMLDSAIEHGIESVPHAPASLRALFGALDRVPVWVDWAAIDRAGDVLFRSGFAGGTVLGAKSLVTGYCSAAGNKPLIFSGQLRRRDRIGYRLAETSRFVVDVCQRGGLRRFGPGFASTVRVRVMHATVRRLLAESGEFDVQRWGEPINQHDMVGTTLLFSLAFLDGVRAFGFRVTPREVDDFLHLWRYNGYLIGVEPELLPTDERRARRMAECIELTQGDPDDDARALVQALVESPLASVADGDAKARAAAKRQVAIGYGLTRSLLGDTMADKLQLPRTSARFVLPAIRRVVARVERVGRRSPAYDARCVAAGQQYWHRAIEMGLAGKPARFMPPTALEGLSDAGRLLSRIVA